MLVVSVPLRQTITITGTMRHTDGKFQVEKCQAAVPTLVSMRNPYIHLRVSGAHSRVIKHSPVGVSVDIFFASRPVQLFRSDTMCTLDTLKILFFQFKLMPLLLIRARISASITT